MDQFICLQRLGVESNTEVLVGLSTVHSYSAFLYGRSLAIFLFWEAKDFQKFDILKVSNWKIVF